MSSDLKQRLIGILYLLPFILGVLAGAPFMNIVIGILQALLCYEFARLLTKNTLHIALYALYFLMTILGFSFDLPFVILAVMAMGCFAMAYMACGLFAALFASVLVVCLISLSLLLIFETAPLYLLALALIIGAGDIGAYLVGRRIGGRKLAPSISPKKTVSGAVGGIIASIIVGLAVAPHIAPLNPNPIIAAMIIGALGQVGDLYESYFKRKLDVKDSSDLIPGHGGFLDRFDGYLFVIPVFLFSLI